MLGELQGLDVQSVRDTLSRETNPWSQSDSNDPSETVENKTANEAMISNACSDKIFVTNFIDMYPL